jgi:hypothetical protein
MCNARPITVSLMFWPRPASVTYVAVIPVILVDLASGPTLISRAAVHVNFFQKQSISLATTSLPQIRIRTSYV